MLLTENERVYRKVRAKYLTVTPFGIRVGRVNVV